MKTTAGDTFSTTSAMKLYLIRGFSDPCLVLALSGGEAAETERMAGLDSSVCLEHLFSTRANEPAIPSPKAYRRQGYLLDAFSETFLLSVRILFRR